MKTFLRKLVEGIRKSEISRQDEEVLRLLRGFKALKERGDFLRLDSKFRVGILDVSGSGTGYLESFEAEGRKDLLIEPDDLNGATKGDIVLARRIFTRGGRAKAKVVQILKKAFSTYVVYLAKEGGKIVARNIMTELPTVVAASQKALRELPEHAVLKIDSTTSRILEVLGVLDDPKVDEKISLAIYDKKEAFSKEALSEAKAYGDLVRKEEHPERLDLTALPFCTIDPPDAKDFDDAIYFDTKAYALYVAIADVSHYVRENSALDEEARSRGFTIYFPHKAIPMLPRSLSENICSLKPREDRLAYTFKITLDPDTLDVKKEELFEAVIRSKRRYTYDRIDRFLAGDTSDKDATDETILSFLLPLAKVLGKIRKKRLESGCEFRSAEVRMKLDENQNLISTTIETETPSHALIEDAMLLANKAAAKRFEKGLFRIHEQPSKERIEALLDELSAVGIYNEKSLHDIYPLIRGLQAKADEKGMREEVDTLIIRAQKQASYAAENIGHFGLGFETYTHFTSPIRRYSDLIVHRLLKALQKKEEKLVSYILQNLEIVAVRVSELEREAAKVAWDFMDRKYARWARAHLQEEVEGVITDAERVPVAITKAPIVGARIFLIDQELQLFQKVKIQLLEAHITTAKIIGKATQIEGIDV